MLNEDMKCFEIEVKEYDYNHLLSNASATLPVNGASNKGGSKRVAMKMEVKVVFFDAGAIVPSSSMAAT